VNKLFEILFLEDAFEFLDKLEKSHREKILYNIRKAQVERDAELLKKLTDEIWELRTLFMGMQYRILAFWDRTDTQETLVIATHGFIKKQSKVPDKEIRRAKQIRADYLEDKKKGKNLQNENIHIK